MTTLSFEASRRVYELIGEYETNARIADASLKFYPSPAFAEVILVVIPKLVDHGSFSWRASRKGIATDLCALYQDATTEPEGMKAVEDYLMKLL